MGSSFKKLFIIQPVYFLFLIFFSIQISAQTDTVLVPSDILPGEGNLNKAVKNVSKSGTLSNTVFKLELNGYYVLTDSILIPAGQHLTIVAPEPGLTQETAPPQILCTSAEGEWGDFNTPFRMMFKCFGNLTLKNIWLLYANTHGWQVTTDITFIRDSLNIDKQYGNFENVIFDYSRYGSKVGGAVTIESSKFIGTFKNCYWKNCTDQHFRYYGRAVSFPYNSTGWHIDTLSFENCTFANIGYVYSQEYENSADFVLFNHCTFLNVVMYSLESGWWYKLAVTNSIFSNTYMYGDIPASHWYSPPYSFNEPVGGTIRIDSVSTFGFKVPFTDRDRHILFANCSYNIDKWLKDWMYDNPYSIDLRIHDLIDEIPEPQPMLSPGTLKFFDSAENGQKVFPYMNRRSLYNSIDPGLILPPTDTVAIKKFLYFRWYCSCDTSWSWKPDNSINRLWPLEENLAYTNQELKTAGMGGFPLGDLFHWWPAEYSQWKAQEENENARISYWLNEGKDSIFTDIKKENTGDEKFVLLQNYPNPFNPVTNIQFRTADFGLVTLKVYDVLGREISTLINEEKSRGNYIIKFDGTGLASGIYFYQLRSGKFLETKKFLLLK